MTQGRVSNGKVKLRKTPNGLMFTIPKSISIPTDLAVGDTFMCEYYPADDTQDDTICFHRIQKFKVRIGE